MHCPLQLKGGSDTAMTRLRSCRFPRIAFLNFILMEAVFMVVLSTSGQAEEGSFDGGLRTAVARVAGRNIPAVVHIEVTQRQAVTNPVPPFENNPFFRYFFGVPGMPRKFERTLKGLGTGMILDCRGHILTNNHVVAGANEIQVLLASGKQYPAKLVGTDPKTDLAVIRILAEGSFPHVTLGDSDKVEVGEWVVAIGHPRGLDETVTQGIISAKHRRGIMVPNSYQDFLQTDAAINPGNSGGPLLNLGGEVIGVNAAIVSQSGGFEGIGFAIPSNMALHIAKELISHGRVNRGWLGARIQDLTPELSHSFEIEGAKGALIADVVKGGPADKGGIARGDVIIAYQGKIIPDAGTLRNEVAITPIGQMAKVTVLSNGKKREALIQIGNPEHAVMMRVASMKESLGADARLLTSKEAARYGLSSNRGVLITALDPNGPLTNAGFEVNDIILEINGNSVKGLEGFVNLVNGLKPNRRITFFALDHRSGRTGYVQVVER
jgi:serine protease Do